MTTTSRLRSAPNAAIWGVEVFIAGGAPSAPSDGDRVRVETPYQADNVTYTPTGPDSGIMALANGANVNYATISIGQFVVDCTNDGVVDYVSSPGGVEHLIYDGVSSEGAFDAQGNPVVPAPFTDTVRVVGNGFANAAADDRFVHTPGNAADAGRVDVSDTTNNQTMLGLAYNNIGLAGTVTVDGLTGNDTLFALGTAANNTINAILTANNAIDIDVTSPLGTHVDLLSVAVENYGIDALDGDDAINFNPVGFDITGNLSIAGGGPAGSDTLAVSGDTNATLVTVTPDALESQNQDITGIVTNPINVAGMELLRYLGNGGDTLVVNPGAGDNELLIESANVGDRVLSDSLPTIEFNGVLRFRANVIAAGDQDIVIFHTDLSGAAPANYEIAADGSDTLVIEGSDGFDDAYTVTNPGGNASPFVRVVDVASGITVTNVTQAVGRLHIQTLGGDDSVTVDVGTVGLVLVPITFDGGTNSDSLTISGTPAGAVTSTYSPGPSVVEGRITHASANAIQVIDFVNLEPVIDLVPGALIVNGTDKNNVIDYRDFGGNGLVSVDEFETIEFANKTNVTLNGGAGNDAFHIGGTTSGFNGTLFINGDTPTLSGDTLTVNGVSPTVTIDHVATTITGTGPADSLITARSSGSTWRLDRCATLAITGSPNYTVNPGAETDQGEVLSSGVPVWFDGFGAGETVALTGTGAGPVTVNGTNADDIFTLTATDTITITGRATIANTALPIAIMVGYEGQDRFDVNGGNSFTRIDVQGGDGDDQDVLNASAAQGPVTVNLGTSTITGYSTAAGHVLNYTGLETINADATGQNMTVVATTVDDTVSVTPLGPNNGTLQANGIDPVVNFSATGTFTVDLLTGGNDKLIVNGTSVGDDITVTGALVTVDPLNEAARETINYLNSEDLLVNGLAGRDTFTVTPAAATSIEIDGGNPVGTTANGDKLIVLPGGAATTYYPGAEGDEGGVDVTGSLPVSWDHIEALQLNVAAGANFALTVNGTNADDEITLITTGAGDFTFSVNDSPAAVVFNAASAALNGLSGDDDMVVQSAVAGFGIPITLDGDEPSSVNDGDTIKINTTSGAETVTYTPTAAGGGTVALATAASTITIVEAEEFLFDGEGDDTLNVLGSALDNLIVHTPGNGRNEGSIRVDETLAVTYEGLDFTLTSLNIDGQAGNDFLVALGTNLADLFVVPGTPDIDVNTQVRINTLQVENYTLDGLDGDDSFTITPVIDASVDNGTGSIPIFVSGEGPSGSDTLNFIVNILDAAPNDVIAALDAVAGPELVQTITQVGLAAVTLLGIETANIDALTNNFVMTGTRFDDVLTYTPTNVDAGTVTSDRISTVFNFEGVIQGTNTFTVTGGAGGVLGDGGFADKLIVRGTEGSDRVRVDGPARLVAVDIQGFGFPPTVLATLRDVRLHDNIAALPAGAAGGVMETVRVDGRGGSDTFHVVPSAPIGNGMFTEIDGGDPSATSDALVITNLDAAGAPTLLAANDFVVIGKGRTPDTGNVLVYQNSIRRPHIAYSDVEIVSANVPLNPDTNTSDTNLLILGPDLSEENETRDTSTFLGSAETINVDNLAIFPNAFEHVGVPKDNDYFRVVAQKTGTLDFQVYFKELNNLVPGNGDLNIQVLDDDGTVIAGTGAFGNNEPAPDNDERVRIPAVAGQTYYLRVYGGDAATPNVVVNGYSLAIINEPAPVPYDIELDDLPVDVAYVCGAANPSSNADTGRSHFDNITCDPTPTVVFRVDDNLLLKDLQGNDGGTFTNDPPDQLISIPFNGAQTRDSAVAGYRVAIFDEGTPQQPAELPQIPIGFARKLADGVYEFNFQTDALDPMNPNGATISRILTDGSHFLTAKVQIIDPATPTQTAWGDRSQSLEIVIDTIVPAVFFGAASEALDGLHPNSDSGVQGPGPGPALEITFSDRITNDTTPTFFGVAEADSFIRAYVDVDNTGTVTPADILIGQTNTLPYDGNNQHGNPTGDRPIGQWELTSVVHMNDPEARNLAGAVSALPFDGLRRIIITSEDVAGNISPAQSLEIFIDTQGPQVTNVFITGNPGHDLFDPKTPDGTLVPTPLVNSISISVRDLPNRVVQFLYNALEDRGDNGAPAESPGNYILRGDFNGIIPIQSVVFTPGALVPGQPATGTIVLTFFEPLPDDRFTLTIKDNVVDPAGNKLDGEANSPQPLEFPNFPSGDGQPGGDFEARFTIDSRPEVGTWSSGNVWIDTNGNNLFDPDNADFVNRDIVYAFGYGSAVFTDRAFTSDDFFAGDFSGPGPDLVFGTADDRGAAAGNAIADGFDKLGAYGSVGSGFTGPFRWIIDYDNDGVPDINQVDPRNINAVPVAGNFDGFAVNGDEIAVFTGDQSPITGNPSRTWYFDTNHDYLLDTSVATPQLIGYPIVGDFDGDGFDDLGAWADDKFTFLLTNGVDKAWLGAGAIFRTIDFGFAGLRERPVAADMDQDGIDDIGVWVPDRSGVTPGEGSEWFFLISNDPMNVNQVNGDVNTLRHAFEPIPFGKDVYVRYGDEFAIPIVGNFDPPAAVNTTPKPIPGAFTNVRDSLDVNDDGFVSPIDALLDINSINETGSRPLIGRPVIAPYYDVSGDGYLSSIDALRVINFLNGDIALAEGEASFDAIVVAEAPSASDSDIASSVVIGLFGDQGEEIIAVESQSTADQALVELLLTESSAAVELVLPVSAADEPFDLGELLEDLSDRYEEEDLDAFFRELGQ